MENLLGANRFTQFTHHHYLDQKWYFGTTNYVAHETDSHERMPRYFMRIHRLCKGVVSYLDGFGVKSISGAFTKRGYTDVLWTLRTPYYGL